MRLFLGQKFLLTLFFLSVVIFSFLQLYLQTNKKTKKSEQGKLQYYEFLESTDYNPSLNKYQGYNSCLVSSEVDYKTIDILQIIDTYHRNDLQDDFKPPTVDNNKLEAIVVPHSHNDPGWINTFEGHYEEQSRFILSNMVAKLTEHKNMTFVWAEMVLFSKWWDEISDEEKQQTRQLLKEGRLEILGGGWVVPDEATTHYQSLLNNFLHGHIWLKKHLNYTPTTSWSLDPFGYSAFLPHLYKRMQLDNMIMLRVHSEVKQYMLSKQLQHFRWRPVWSSNANDTDYHMNAFMLPYKLYNIKYQCGPDNDVCLQFDFRQIIGEFSESRAIPVTTSNIYQLSSLLAKQLRKKASLQRNKGVVMFPLGDDFRYDKDVEWDQQYKNYMKLMRFINSKPQTFNMTLRFGVVKDFFNILNRDQAKKESQPLPSLSGDFFPYSDIPGDYWTGYFTSRIWLKKSIRMLESLIHAAEIIHLKTLFLSANDASPYESVLEELLNHVRSNVSLLQHHDAITGTSTIQATRDFYVRSINAFAKTESIIRQSMKHALLSLQGFEKTSDYAQFRVFSENLNLNFRKFLLIGPSPSQIILFNPLITTYTEIIEFKIETNKALFTKKGEENYIHLRRYNGDKGGSHTTYLPCVVTKGPTKRIYSFYFNDPLAPLSYQFYEIYTSNEPANSCHFQNDMDYKLENKLDFDNFYGKSDKKEQSENNEFFIKTECFSIAFNKDTGNLVKIKFSDQPFQKVKVQFLAYTANGDGPYLFKPLKEAAEIWSESGAKITVTNSSLFQIVEVQVSEAISVKYKISNAKECFGGASIGVEMFTDMKEDKNLNQEFIIRIKTDINSDFFFTTDSNAFNPLLRRRMPSLAIPANYYPATSYAFIENIDEIDNKDSVSDNYRLTLLMSEPHGVTSGASGELEVMLDRMTSYNDAKGVSDGLSDNRATISNFKILFERFENNKVADTNMKSEKNGINSLRHPSLDAFLSALQLRHKPVLIGSTSLTPDLIDKFIHKDIFIDPSSIPCDIALSSVRHLHKFLAKTRVTSKMATYFALHRFSWQAGFHVSSFHETHSKYGCKLKSIASNLAAPKPLTGAQFFTNCDLRFSSFFPSHRKISSITPSSLTLLHLKNNINPSGSICLNASSLNAFMLVSSVV